MSFFELPPRPAVPEPEPELAPEREWFGPPANVLGVAAPVQLVVARSARAVVVARRFTCFPSGLSFELHVVRRTTPDDPRAADPFEFRRRVAAAGLPDELLRFGLLFSNGRKVTTVDYGGWAAPGERPRGPVLNQRGGGGGARSFTRDFWLWPLPPAGRLTFAAEWPAEQIADTRAEIDAEPFLVAAARAETLWPPQRRESGGSYSVAGFTQFQAVTDDDEG